MLFDRFATAAQLSELRERSQRLEMENASLRTRVEAHDAPCTTAGYQGPSRPELMTHPGEALAMRSSVRRGSAGGLARAHQALRLGERWLDGRFMAHSDWEQIKREASEAAYMRYAAGGFARARSAHRLTDGTFVRSE